jgi:peptide/nickel transport system substrate-binding protein
MKRTVSNLLAIIISVFLLASCGGSGETPIISDEGVPEGTTAAEKIENTTTAQAETNPETKAETQATATTAETTTSEAFEVKEGDVSPGYYNLDDFTAQTGKQLTEFKESPMLASKVSSGDLPPVKERLPDNPCVFRTIEEVGEYGGTMRFTSINIDQDWHLRHINAANLIEQQPNPAWDTVSTVFGVTRQPGILEDYSMSADGMVFRATIRKGLKWSDGVPVTTEDVKFRINDIYLNKDLSPVAPSWLIWGGSATQLNIVDANTFELKFSKPYGSFIEAFVTLWPGTFQRFLIPKHYMEKYHPAYNSEENILGYMETDGYVDMGEWREWFNRKVGFFGCDNTLMDAHGFPPTLNPWTLVEDLGNGSYRLERNPYFYMVDQDGNQLPYIDGLRRSFVTNEEVDNMAIISGEVDISCMTLSIENFPLYKDNEDNGNYFALPLPAYQDQIFITGFNANAGIRPPRLTSVTGAVEDELPEDSAYNPELADVYGDVRFRRAMSLALDRKVFNETLFLGLGRPAQVAPRPGTPFFTQAMEDSYAAYDPDQAKALLDEMGMEYGADGWRMTPGGNPFKVMYEYFVITGASTPGAELCKRYWEDVGIQVEVKLVDTSYWWEVLQPNNMNEATTWWLAGSGANLLQNWFLGPSMLVPLWNRYTQYIDSEISEDDWNNLVLPYVPEWQREMQDLKIALLSEPVPEKRIAIGTRMWELQAEWLPIIGTVTEARSPLILSKDIAGMDCAEDMGFNYISVMEQSEIFWFRNPARK